ncbi:GTPase [Streptomyces sp. Rer75]|uniref:GTPase n=1 Tax=unclassified Streptomyces TaxID=2593676 RepID=UPI0015CFFEB0|nr:GTPase [Streptomyces sp. Rer75]QLH21810.1 50S ribosome-binding GTPase [Streptomyces sp. Rer75]
MTATAAGLDGGDGGGGEAASAEAVRTRQTWDDGLIARRAGRRAARRAPRETFGTEAPAAWTAAGSEPREAGGSAGSQGAYGAAGAYASYGSRDASEPGEPSYESYGSRDPYKAYEAYEAYASYERPFGPGARSFAAGSLRPRLDALRQLVGLSRTRLDGRTLAGAGRVLDEAAARGRHPLGHTVVALAGATGSGKSTLFNALAGAPLSECGIRRPTTAAPLSCAWTDHADGLLDRLGIPHADRRRPAYPYDPALRGLVLLDLPDHDSAAPGHRDRVDRLLGLVDAVVWVVDPEKYADAVLHERYLRPLAGYAEVTFVVLNQVDRLPGDAADQVLDDLRRLLDEDGLALGEHGEPGAAVLALSALTGEGVGELREMLGGLAAECGAAERRLAADVDGTTARLRPQYVADGAPAGFTGRARAEFEDRLAEAAGAAATGQAAERAWLRDARKACGTPWGRLARGGRRAEDERPVPGARAKAAAMEAVTARPAVEEAVRTLADEATAGLPGPWAQAVREAAVWGGRGLPEAVDEAVAAARRGQRLTRPAWWSAVAAAQVVLLVLQVVGAVWLVGAVAGLFGGPGWLPAALVAGGALAGTGLAWACGLAARGPARRYGRAAEARLRDAAVGCGRARVLAPVGAELARYREVRAQYVIAAGEG